MDEREICAVDGKRIPWDDESAYCPHCFEAVCSKHKQEHVNNTCATLLHRQAVKRDAERLAEHERIYGKRSQEATDV